MADITIIAPEEGKLTCKIVGADPEPEIKWFKDTRQISADKKYDMSFTKEVATLTIKDSVLKDAAKYKCEAVNKIGSVDTTATVTVHGR